VEWKRYLPISLLPLFPSSRFLLFPPQKDELKRGTDFLSSSTFPSLTAAERVLYPFSPPPPSFVLSSHPFRAFFSHYLCQERRNLPLVSLLLLLLWLPTVAGNGQRRHCSSSSPPPVFFCFFPFPPFLGAAWVKGRGEGRKKYRVPPSFSSPFLFSFFPLPFPFSVLHCVVVKSGVFFLTSSFFPSSMMFEEEVSLNSALFLLLPPLPFFKFFFSLFFFSFFETIGGDGVKEKLLSFCSLFSFFLSLYLVGLGWGYCFSSAFLLFPLFSSFSWTFLNFLPSFSPPSLFLGSGYRLMRREVEDSNWCGSFPFSPPPFFFLPFSD